jgi:hypothetical protein
MCRRISRAPAPGPTRRWSNHRRALYAYRRRRGFCPFPCYHSKRGVRVFARRGQHRGPRPERTASSHPCLAPALHSDEGVRACNRANVRAPKARDSSPQRQTPTRRPSSALPLQRREAAPRLTPPSPAGRCRDRCTWQERYAAGALEAMSAFLDGRGWVRTSDLSRVRRGGCTA